MSFDPVARVAVEKAAFSFDREFDYLVPAHLAADCAVGKRVLVPFGRGDSRRQGIVTALTASGGDGRLKPLLAVLDSEPVMSEKLLETARFMKEHYFCTLYDAVKTMLPAGINYRVTTVYGVRDAEEQPLSDEQRRIVDYLRRRRQAVKLETILDAFALTDSAVLDELVRLGVLYKSDEAFRRVSDAVMKMAALSPGCDPEQCALTPRQREVCELLEMTGAASVKEIRYFTGVSASGIDALFQKRIIYFFDEEVFRTGDLHAEAAAPPLTISDGQQVRLAGD